MPGKVPDPLSIATHDGDLTIDFATREVTINGVALKLTPIECDILLCLASSYGTVVPTEDLVAAVWGEWYGQRGHVSVHVHHLRRKLGPFGRLVVNKRGVGYSLDPPARDLALPANWPEDLTVLFQILSEDAVARGVAWLFVERNMRISWVSDSVSDLLGWTPLDMVGREPRDFVAAEDVPAFLLNFPVSHGPPRVQFDTRAYHRDRSLVPVRIQANVFYQADGSRLAGLGEWSRLPWSPDLKN